MQPEIFRGRGGFVELGHFDKLFLKNTQKKTPEGKILELFLLDTLKTIFWMEDSTQGWTQLGPFFPKSGHFFRFWKKGRVGLLPLVACLLSSKVVYKFVCASCNVSYVCQTHQYLTTTIDEHFGKVKKSHIYQHIMSSADCLNAYSRQCFPILDTARTKHQLTIKENLFISWLKPTLNKQKSHQYITSLSIWPLLC